MTVKVYRNLNRKGVVWSLKDPKTGLVVDRVTTAYLSNAKMLVSEVGRMRVLKERRKNVHAYVKGTRLKCAPKVSGWTRVAYNPYRQENFETSTGRKVCEARYVKFTKNGCYVSNQRA